MSIFEKIFSVKNDYNEFGMFKVVNILGKKIRVRIPKPTRIGRRKLYSTKEANEKLLEALNENKPFSLIRVGNSELCTINQYIRSVNKKNIEYSEDVHRMMKYGAGFFSVSDKELTLFAQKAIECIKNSDFLSLLWFKGREYRMVKCAPKSRLIDYKAVFEDLIEDDEISWLQYLKGKKVLVIHPFEKTILEQYKKRKLLFKNPDFLPEFELKTLKTVQGLKSSEIAQYNSWWDALDSMCKQIEETDFDVAIIAAGAFGIFLADKVKQCGKQAIQLCGVTQLLFGIKGGRWDENLGKSLYNEHWVRVSQENYIDNITEFLELEGGKPAYF